VVARFAAGKVCAQKLSACTAGTIRALCRKPLAFMWTPSRGNPSFMDTQHDDHKFPPGALISYEFPTHDVMEHYVGTFILQFSFDEHRNRRVTYQNVGGLSLRFHLPEFGPETMIDGYLVEPEFNSFAAELLNRFPGLGLLINLEEDTGFKKLVYAGAASGEAYGSRTELGFERTTSDVAESIERLVKGCADLAEKIWLDPRRTTEICSHITNHLIATP
jgi:hypothetical protein